MNPEVKQQWLDALRSGEYEQGQRCLRTADDKYCCLGVLTDLYVRQHDEGDWQFAHQEIIDAEPVDVFGFGGVSAVLPQPVQEWAGLSDENPEVADDRLTSFNDGEPIDELEPYSFEQIADLIERYL